MNPDAFTTSATQGEIRDALRALRPHALVGHSKARFGNAGDGGYICVDDFSGIDTALSFGIRDDVSWDADIVERGITVYQFDHTVDAPVADEPRMIFARKRIAIEAGPTSESIVSLVARHDKRGTRPNLILKMDIECDEWPVFDATGPDILGRFSQIVCEFHAFENMNDEGWRLRVKRVLQKLSIHFAAVHVHANNYAETTVAANVFMPNVIEVTLANRHVYDLIETDELFPGPLDVPCDATQPDIFLGSFRY